MVYDNSVKVPSPESREIAHNSSGPFHSPMNYHHLDLKEELAMKQIRTLLCTLLALMTALWVFPAAAFAEAPTGEITVTAKYFSKTDLSDGGSYYGSQTVEVADKAVTLKKDLLGGYVQVGSKTYEAAGFLDKDGKLHNTFTIPACDGTEQWQKNWENAITLVFVPHSHSYESAHNRLNHWKACACGKTKDKEPHVDPAADEDKVCTCGYKFSSNADLTTLWLRGVSPDVRFQKDITEYTGQVITYRDITETKITARSFDALASIELPEDLSIHEGKNTFQITVTAEDKTTKKTYTFTAIKPAKVEKALISTLDGVTTVEPNVNLSNNVADVAITEAIGEKIVEQAAEEDSTQICISPTVKKWSAKRIEVTIPGSVLASLEEDTQAEVLITTIFGDVTISREELTELAEEEKDILITIEKDGASEIANK